MTSRLSETNGWDVSAMDGSGYASKLTVNGTVLECVPGARGFQAHVGARTVSGRWWDMPDGAMDEAQAAFESQYPPFTTAALRARVLEEIDAHQWRAKFQATGFEQVGRARRFNVWHDAPDGRAALTMTVEGLVRAALDGQPVTVRAVTVFQAPNGQAWFTVTVRWNYGAKED